MARYKHIPVLPSLNCSSSCHQLLQLTPICLGLQLRNAFPFDTVLKAMERPSSLLQYQAFVVLESIRPGHPSDPILE